MEYQKPYSPSFIANPRSIAPDTENDAPHHPSLVGVTRWLVVWTAALVFVGICTFGAALLQWAVMSGQLTEMRNAGEDTKRAVEATNRLATAAEASAQIARDTEIRQLRAYLVINSTAAPNLVPGKQAEAYFDIINTGRTPAYKVTTRAFLEIRPYPPPALTSYTVPKPIGFVETVINPERTESIGIEKGPVLTREQIAEIIDGSRVRLYVWGTIYFFDAFGVERYVNFCEIMGGNDMKSGTGCTHRGAN